MKTMNRRPKTTLARVLLAAFLVTLPGSREAFAQVAGRSGPAVSATGPVGITGVIGGVSAAPGLSAPLSPAALSLSPLGAPSLAAPVPNAAAAAAIPAAIPAALKSSARPAAILPDARAGAKAALTGAAGRVARIGDRTSADDARGLAASAFDGISRAGAAGDVPSALTPARGAAAGGDGSNGGGPLVPSRPAIAPVIALTKVFFPGVNDRRFGFTGEKTLALVKLALRNGGWMIATTAGSNEKGQSDAAVLTRISHLDESNPAQMSVMMSVVDTVQIIGYGAKDEVPVAKVVYPKQASDAKRLEDLGSLAQHTLEELARLDPALDKDVVKHALMEKSSERLANLLAQELPFPDAVKQRLLAEPSTEALMQAVILEMTAHFKGASDAAKPKAKGDGEKGGAGNGAPVAEALKTVEALKTKMKIIGMPDAIQETVLSEYRKYSEMNPKDSEAQKLRQYMEWLLEMPWSRRTEDNLDIPAARKILDADHFGLERVKERVLEFLALRKKTGSKKGAIIAFTGPPGVGKTSIASAIAQALGRKFVRLSLGGVHDESVLRGHGRTYVGSMPGEIMRQMKNAGTVNPVMLMDEADKIGRNGNHGDPTAALLEILDPAQNNTYRDRYLDVPYDLSEVLFVVTSNELMNIPEPLRDRMEIIEFDGYTTLEKIEIANRHIIPQKLKVTGLKPEEASLTKAAIMRVIEGYTMEAGVRKLREQIESLLRKISAWTETRGLQAPGKVDAKDVEKYLGVERFSPRETAQNGIGVATGLAVNTYGGSTLNVEVSKEPGTGQLKLRKQFGDDIEDSAKNALKYVKQNKEKFGLKDFDFTKYDIDINITPAGKVDGPSAGGLMVTAIISALTGRSVTPGLAMTGEITMRGDVLPIGGLKQKVMAAHRMGYKMVIFPHANLKDVEDIPQEVRDGIKLKAVKTYDEIYPDAVVPAEDAPKS